jgi:hypothetical protein
MAEEIEQKAMVAVGRKGLELQDMDGMFRFAKAVAMSGLAPKGLEKPEAIFVAVQLGLELGLSPMAALQNIGVINGRPGIFGDAALALVRSSGVLEEYYEQLGGAGDARFCKVYSKRRGASEPMETTFTVGDAKRAKLWGKPGPWSDYPDRMLKFRARGFNLRDNFGDILKGFRTTEELQDMPDEERRFESAKPATRVADPVGEIAAPADDQAEADAGLAPVKPRATKPAKAEAAEAVDQGGSNQEKLAAIVIGWGHDFTTFQKWGIESGNIENADDLTSFDEVPDTVAARFLRAKNGLKIGLDALKGGVA